MTSQPEISLIMTARNAERWVGDAVGSVVAQDFQRWELIVWDDGSEDGTSGAAHDAAGDDERVRLICALPTGRNAALRAAVEKSRGAWIAFLDADDALTADALSTLAKARAVGAEVLYSDTELHPAHDLFGDRARGRRPIWRNVWPGEYPAGLLQMQAYRRDAYEALGGIDPGYPYAMLYHLFLRALQAGLRCERVPRPLYVRRLHPESLTAQHRDEALAWARRALEEVSRG